VKKYFGLLKYAKAYKKHIVLYFIYNIFSVLFSVVSIAMLFPFMQLIFTDGKLVTEQPALAFNTTSILTTLQYYLSKLMIQHGSLYALGIVCIFIVVSIFLKNLFVYLTYYTMTPIRNGVMVQLRNDLYNKVLNLPIGYFTEKRKSDLISRMTEDTWELDNAVANTLFGLIKEPITILFFLSFLIFLSPELSLILLVLLPVAGFIIGKASKSLKKSNNIAAEKSAEGLGILEETISGMRIIKAFTAESLIQKKFNTVNKELFDVKNKINYKRDLASPLSEFLGIVVLSIILWFGGKLILTGAVGLSLNGASFILYIAAFSQIINPAKSLSAAFYNMQRGTTALNRIEEIMKAPNTIINNPNAITLADFNSTIELKNVCFSYNQTAILKNINLTIKKGQTIALVGSSGAGKSTLADLIPRFHDVSEGEVLIDGINLKDYTLESLRNQISVVTQEPILFNDTIFNNIILGKQTATLQEVEQAAKIANAYNFIQQKTDTFQHSIGDRGVKLSGGEKQRLTIARAILKNPPILILDEATSSLDTESERLVQDAINKLMQNRTSIVIAHRLSTIRHADEIVVLDKGEIVERGTHDTLLLQNGIYKKLVDMQEVK